MIVIRSPAFNVISFALWPAKSYKTLYCGSRGAAGGAGGGGGGIARPEDVEEVFLVWLGIGVGLGGCGTLRSRVTGAYVFATGFVFLAALDSFEGRPPGPPG
jgi:hypothetical protein